MIGKKVLKTKKSGFTMTLAVFAMILLLLTGVGVLSLGQNARIFAIRNVEEVAARSAADCGLTKALWKMNDMLERGVWEKKTLLWESDTELPNSDATYSFIAARAMEFYGDIMPAGNEDLIEFIRSASWKEGDYVIKSHGRYGAAQKIIYGIVGLKGPCDAGVLVRDSITLKAGTLVDGRDSRDPTNLDVEVEIGTLSTESGKVILNNGVEIDGNVLVGVGGDPGTVIKDLGVEEPKPLMYALPEEPPLPLIYPPADLLDKGKLEAKGDTVYFTDANSGIYTGIDLAQLGVDKPGKLEITSGNVVLYITGDINMGVRCEIIIRDGATLNLYVDGDIKAGEDSGFNNESVPPAFKLWGNWRGTDVEQKWQLNAKSKYFGQLYAPNADVTVMAKGDLYGAFTAESFEMKSGGNLFYDGALQDVNPDDEGVRFILNRWREQ